jgi:hypothetical protein
VQLGPHRHAAPSRTATRRENSSSGILITGHCLQANLRTELGVLEAFGFASTSGPPQRRIGVIRVIIARVFDPVCGDDHPYITRSVTGDCSDIRRKGDCAAGLLPTLPAPRLAEVLAQGALITRSLSSRHDRPPGRRR